ncbi:MAG: CoA-binding protein [Gemmatimonadetes bacterium]|nr:CoA-binding protein [Gemmatimonadota bacterium]
MEDWRKNLIEDRAAALEILRRTRRIAVIGIKPESHAGQPAHSVPAYLQRAGYELVPVPSYYPEVTEILGQPVCRKLSEVPGDIDLVVVFRRPADLPGHVPDILAKAPRAVWFQTGIRHPQAAEQLAMAGILVVQDRCAMVEHRHLREG